MAQTLHYLTRKEYADLRRISKQAVWNAINRGKLKTETRRIPTETEVIVLTDEEYQNISKKKQG